MNKSLLYFFAVFLFWVDISFSQNENSKWYFGHRAGVDFMTNPPTALANSAMTAWEGSASISDINGNLLFYTHYDTIWNQNHQPMANGTGLTGFGSGTQTALIIKQPGHSNIYYVFKQAQSLGLRYSIVDMNLAAGMGSVTAKNILLVSPCTEKLHATKHCNGSDVWILAHQQASNNFLTFLLTTNGISSTPTLQPIGTAYNSFGGNIKFSTNGRKVAVACGLSSSTSGIVELFDFDNSTGVLSNAQTISVLTTSNSAYFSCDFSPDGTKLYASHSFSPPIRQWDLCAGSTTAIAASEFTIPTIAGNVLRLAPDGKIYVVQNAYGGWLHPSLDVINDPNLAGNNCNYMTGAVTIFPGLTLMGLPNYLYVFDKPPPPPFTYTVNLCNMVSFTAPIPFQNYTVVSCSSSGYSVAGMAWDFGDPGSGGANVSSSNNPAHVYTAMGQYTAQLVIYYSCGGGTDTIRQTVNVNQPCISLGSTSITCASLGSATANINGATGPFGYTWNPTGQTNSVATGLIPGSYTISILDLGTNLTYTSSAIFYPLVPLTATISNADSIRCNGANTGTAAVVNLAGGSGNQNYLWTNGFQSYTTASTNNLTGGLWNIIITDALTGCVANQWFFISQPPPFGLNVSSNTPSVCLGGNIVLTGTNSGGTPFATSPPYTYTWTNPATAGPTATVNEATGGTYVYTLNSTDGNNCLVSNTIAVDFVNHPVLSLSDASICPLAYGTLSVSGASTYTWNNNTIGNTLIDNPSTNTQYTVVGSALGCTTAATASIVLKSIPFPFAFNNGPKCEATSVNLSAYGGTAYAWSGPNGFNSLNQFPILNSISVSDAGVYQVTVTAANSCTAVNSATVVVYPTPTLSAFGSTVCTSGTLNLSANSFTGSSYQWNGPLNFSSSLQNPFIANPALNRSGTYTVKVTSAQSCTNVATVICSVVTPPSLTVSLSGTGSLCAQALNGSPNSITLTSGGANTYTLNTPNNLYNPNPAGPVVGLSSLPPFSGTFGYATATLVGSNGICTSSTTAVFTIVPNPTVGINSFTPVICAGQNYTYTSNGANSYSWGPNSPGLNTYTSPVTVASPTVTSVYSVVGGSLGCNSPTQTSTLTVYPLPTVSISPLNPNLCLHQQITLTALGDGASFWWSPFEGLNDIVGQTVTASPERIITYTVIATSVNNCTNSAVTTISILPLPEPIFNISKKEICLNETLQFSGEGGITYEYRGPDDLYYQGQTVTLTANHMAYAGMYILVVTDKNGCANFAYQNLIIHSLPSGSLKGDLEGCVPYCGKFLFSGNTSSTIASWRYDRQYKEGNSFEMCFNQAGIQTVKGYFYDQKTGCKNEEQFSVNVHEKPEADFTYEPQQIIEGLDRVQFTSTSQGENIKQFNWYFINNKGYSTKTEHPNYLFENAGVYPIALVVKDQWGCLDTIVKSIKVEPDFTIYVPNTFTPNEDDKNEIFLPVLRGETLFHLQIFNRWGTKVFETKDPTQGWDGTFGGEPCKQDVYTWKIQVSSLDGQAKEYTGYVLLHR